MLEKIPSKSWMHQSIHCLFCSLIKSWLKVFMQLLRKWNHARPWNINFTLNIHELTKTMTKKPLEITYFSQHRYLVLWVLFTIFTYLKLNNWSDWNYSYLPINWNWFNKISLKTVRSVLKSKSFHQYLSVLLRSRFTLVVIASLQENFS